MAVDLTNDKIRAISESANLFDAAKSLVFRQNYSLAAPLLSEAFRLREFALGSNDEGLAPIADELGLVYLKLTNYEKAAEQLKLALSILEKNFYPGHAKHVPVLEHEGDCLIQQGKYAEAEPLLKRALEISEKTVCGEHRIIFELIWKLSDVYEKLDKLTDAEALINKAIKQLDTPLGPAAEFRHRLAVILASLGKNDEAIAAFHQAIEGLQQRGDYSRLANCLESFAALLRKCGQDSEATRISQRAQLIRRTWQNETIDIFPCTLLRA